MITMMKKVAAAAGFAAALAGCTMSSGTTYHIDNPFLFFNSAARGGNFPIVIVGQPYPGRQAGVEAAVSEGFSRTFSTFPKPVIAQTDDVRWQRLVVLFNAGRPLAQDVCRRANQMAGGVGSAGDKVSAVAVYCGGTEPYSSAWIDVPAPSGPETAEFRDAMTRLVREAIPREMDPSRRNDRDAPTPPR